MDPEGYGEICGLRAYEDLIRGSNKNGAVSPRAIYYTPSYLQTHVKTIYASN